MELDVNVKLKELFSLEGKVILITGAAGGIFSEVSRGMAQVGGRMALCDFNMEGLKAVEDEIQGFGGEAKSFAVDMTSLESIHACVDQVVEAYGRIDVLVNGAGINKRVKLLNGDEETFDRIVAVNLKGVHFLSQEVAKHMKETNAIGPGHISTPLTAPLWTDPVRSKFLLDRIAMNRPGEPKDLLGIAILLASDASGYMSGMMYHVDGGCLAGGQPWDI